MWLTNCTVIDVENPDRSFTGALRIEEERIVETAETFWASAGAEGWLFRIPMEAG